MEKYIIIVIIPKSTCKPIRNPSPKQPFFLEPMISLPLPYPRPHTNAQKLFWHTSNPPCD